MVDADDAVWPRGPGIVDDGGITLDPDPAPAFGHEPVVLGRHLTFQ